MTLTEFLLARIAEDENVAQGSRGVGDGDSHLRRAWPEGVLAGRVRVLADCEAKRRIVELPLPSEHVPTFDGEGNYEDEINVYPWDDCHDAVLRLLALPYAGHSDYDEAWRP